MHTSCDQSIQLCYQQKPILTFQNRLLYKSQASAFFSSIETENLGFILTDPYVNILRKIYYQKGELMNTWFQAIFIVKYLSWKQNEKKYQKYS